MDHLSFFLLFYFAMESTEIEGSLPTERAKGSPWELEKLPCHTHTYRDTHVCFFNSSYLGTKRSQ